MQEREELIGSILFHEQVVDGAVSDSKSFACMIQNHEIMVFL